MMQPSEKTCVLYVAPAYCGRRVSNDPALAAAQAQALRLGVPLAVVSCIPEATAVQPARSAEATVSLMDTLREAEQALARFGLPYMVLIGDEQARLEGLFYHTRPQAVVYAGAGGATQHTQGSLVYHPHAWPGVVIAVDDLQPFIEGRVAVCG